MVPLLVVKDPRKLRTGVYLKTVREGDSSDMLPYLEKLSPMEQLSHSRGVGPVESSKPSFCLQIFHERTRSVSLAVDPGVSSGRLNAGI
jgi:hypothetical protein